jgi:hypothetical protein
MVFITTFNNISVISWQAVLLVEETGVPEKTTDQWTSHRNSLLRLSLRCDIAIGN